ncbi:MAG: hypothetical protein KIT14_09260 [bacterium]|nr:hypothetical protein [bacterium]
MKTSMLAIFGLLALAIPASADKGPIPMRDPRLPPSIQKQAAERPYALTGSQRPAAGEWNRTVQVIGGGRSRQTVYTR